MLVVLILPLLHYLLLQEIGCGLARFWPNEIFAMARWPVQILATIGLFGRTMPWRTSLKNVKARIHWKLMAPQILVMLINIYAIIYAYLKIKDDFKTGPLFNFLKVVITEWRFPETDMFGNMATQGYTTELVVIAGFWAFYHALRALCFIIKVIGNARDSHSFFRFAIPLPLYTEQGFYGRINKISEIWVNFCLFGNNRKINIGDIINTKIFLPAGQLDVQVIIKSLKQKPENTLVEGEFIWDIQQSRDKLALCLHSVDWHREFTNRHKYFKTPSDTILSWFSFKKPVKDNWNPLLYSPAAEVQPCYGVISVDSKNPAKSSFITFTELKPGQVLHGMQFLIEGTSVIQFKVMQEQMISSLVQKCLDGTVVRRYQAQIQTVAEKPSKVEIPSKIVRNDAIAFVEA